MNGLDAAIARTEIDALIAEFAYRIDHGFTDTVADLFTESGWYGRHDGGRSVGHDAIRKAYAARNEQGVRTARHIFTNVRLTFSSPEAAAGKCILLLFAAQGEPPLPAIPALVQDYTDTFEKVGGTWLFASRETRPIFVGEGFTRVLPLGGARS